MVLVTGATGLLGSHVVVELLNNGFAVRAMLRDEKRKAVIARLLNYYYPDKATLLYNQIEWVFGDIEDLTDVKEALIGVEKVVHCAALVSFHRRDFWRLINVNRKGTANMVNFSHEAGIKQFVHVSSTAAIGSETPETDGIKRESNHWNAGEKVSGYSMSKYNAEKEVWRAKEEGLAVSIVNPSLLFGPGSWDESSLTILRTLKNGLKFYTKGANAFVDVRDVTEIILRMLKEEKTGERYLVTGTNTTFKAFFNEACKQMQVKAPSILAGPFLTGLAWRLSGIFSRMVGKRPTITKESARSSQQITVYSNEKVLNAFPGFQFRSLEDTLENTIRGRMDE